MKERLVDDLAVSLGDHDHRRGLLKTAVAGTLAVAGFGIAADNVLGKKCKNDNDCPDDKECKNKKRQNNGKVRGRCKR